jgi:hypothetical protein
LIHSVISSRSCTNLTKFISFSCQIV